MKDKQKTENKFKKKFVIKYFWLQEKAYKSTYAWMFIHTYVCVYAFKCIVGKSMFMVIVVIIILF